MKKLAFLLLTISISAGTAAQKLGSKKNILLQLTGYDCGDACTITWKDIKSGTLYGFDNIDEITKDNGILSEIQRTYYASGESDKKIKGSLFKATVQYRTTDEYKNESPDEPPQKTGKKITRWMIDTLEK